MLWLQASSGEEAGLVSAPMGGEGGGVTTEPRVWIPRLGPSSQHVAPHCHAVGALTFHSARTSRASSRRPPSVLPTMIQMGICQSSCLEISNVICKGRRGGGGGQVNSITVQRVPLRTWGRARTQKTASTCWEVCIPFLREMLEGWVARSLQRPQSSQLLHSGHLT